MVSPRSTQLRILLGVTGGIAAYKSPDLVRRLRERGAEVQVVMTAGARQFVTPLTFQAVSGRPVRTDLWDAAAEAAMGHIELARWADLVVIAPATADFMARLAHGLADDLLTTLCLATAAPIVRGAGDESPDVGECRDAGERRDAAPARRRDCSGRPRASQACGETGPGRMLEPPEIADADRSRRRERWQPTRCAAARCWSRPGRRASASIRCASSATAAPARWATRWREAAREAGAEVVIVSGPGATCRRRPA